MIGIRAQFWRGADRAAGNLRAKAIPATHLHVPVPEFAGGKMRLFHKIPVAREGGRGECRPSAAIRLQQKPTGSRPGGQGCIDDALCVMR